MYASIRTCAREHVLICVKTCVREVKNVAIVGKKTNFRYKTRSSYQIEHNSVMSFFGTLKFNLTIVSWSYRYHYPQDSYDNDDIIIIT